MHVIHVYDGHEQVYGGRGSVPGVVWNIARETAAEGHDVTVLERRWNGLQATTTHEGVKFRRLNLRMGADEPWTRVPYEMVKSPLSLARLVGDRAYFAARAVQELKQQTFDVVHVHLPFAASVMLTIAPWLRNQTVYTAHLGELRLDALNTDTDADVPGVLSRFSPDIFLAERAEHTTVLNPVIRQQFVERGIEADSVSVVPNGVDIDRFANVNQDKVESVRERYSLGDARIVLFVGTLMPRKGVIDLVDAFANLVTRFENDVKLVLAGESNLDETYTQAVETRIDELGLNAHVNRLGFVDASDLPGLYTAADVCVIPSHEEGFGMTAVEAMAAGTPVVGTHVGALPQLLEDTKTGQLVEVGNIQGISEGLERLLKSSKRSKRAKNQVEAFSWSGITKQLETIYKEKIK